MNLIELRKKLHSHPELSGHEEKTLRILSEFLEQYQPSKKIALANGKGLLVEFDSGIPGPHILYRADLDALPIQEEGVKDHASKEAGVSHKCGHDGHMALACSLPAIWENVNGKVGKLGLLFQHAEEIAAGAKEIIHDEEFRKWDPDFIFGLHNLPGVSVKEVVLTRDVFSCASLGLRIDLMGVSSHAGEPEKANSPFYILQELSNLAEQMCSPLENDEFFLSTLVHVKLGEENFGIRPGDGRISFTLRAKKTQLLLKNKERLIKIAQQLAEQAKIKIRTEVFDFFPATINHPDLVEVLRQSAERSGLRTTLKTFPFRWSEDFGYYSDLCPAAFFGMGNGESSFPLHHPMYDFNDSLIEQFQKLFSDVLEVISLKKNLKK